MSVEALALVLNHSRLSGTAKLVLIGIANHDGDGGAWPSIETLARYANTTERTVQRAIAEAVAAGELAVEDQAGGTQRTRADRRPNLYRTLVTCPVGCDRTMNHKISGNGVTPVSPRGADGVTSMVGRGDIRDANGVTPVSPEPPREPSVEPEHVGGADVVPIDTDIVEARAIANYLSARLGDLDVPANRRVVTDTWVAEIRRMIQRDGRSPEQIRKAIDWAMADSFWRGTIQSPVSLRKHYDKMRLQAARAQHPSGRDSQQRAVADEAALTGRPVEEVRADRMKTITDAARIVQERRAR